MAPTSSPVRIGVIGLGQWGPNHVRNLRMVEGCEVARVCDSADSRAGTGAQAVPRHRDDPRPRVRDRRPLTSTPWSWRRPSQSHFPLVRQALEAGKDVLCEKPLALNSARARALCAVARRRRRILMVGHVFLYNPCTLHLKRAIDRGDARAHLLHGRRPHEPRPRAQRRRRRLRPREPRYLDLQFPPRLQAASRCRPWAGRSCRRASRTSGFSPSPTPRASSATSTPRGSTRARSAS